MSLSCATAKTRSGARRGYWSATQYPRHPKGNLHISLTNYTPLTSFGISLSMIKIQCGFVVDAEIKRIKGKISCWSHVAGHSWRKRLRGIATSFSKEAHIPTLARVLGTAQIIISLNQRTPYRCGSHCESNSNKDVWAASRFCLSTCHDPRGHGGCFNRFSNE